MQENNLELKIAYLYPDILQGFCDEANIEAFCRRTRVRNINITTDYITAHTKIQAEKYDFFYIGGSNVEYLEYALTFLKENETELFKALNSKTPMLSVGVGFYLFGNFYQPQNKSKIETLGLINSCAVYSKKLIYGTVTGVCNFLENKTIAGFENRKILTKIANTTQPFIHLKKGCGNIKSKTEGARNKNLFATNIQSPILAQNPHFCDFLIQLALKNKYHSIIPLNPLCDDVEWYVHNSLLESK